MDRGRAGVPEHRLADGRHRPLHCLRRARQLGRLARPGPGGPRLGRAPRAGPRRAPGGRRHGSGPRRGALRRLPGADGADRPDLGSLVARDPGDPVPVACGRDDPRHRLLGRRQRPPPTRRLPLPSGPARPRAGDGLHPRRRLDDRRQARAGQADDVRARRPGLGLRRHQLPAEPEGDLAGPHRRRQARRRLGEGEHRRVRRRPLLRRGQWGVGGWAPVRAAGPQRRRPCLPARVRGAGHLACRPASPSTG